MFFLSLAKAMMSSRSATSRWVKKVSSICLHRKGRPSRSIRSISGRALSLLRYRTAVRPSQWAAMSSSHAYWAVRSAAEIRCTFAPDALVGRTVLGRRSVFFRMNPLAKWRISGVER